MKNGRISGVLALCLAVIGALIIAPTPAHASAWVRGVYEVHDMGNGQIEAWADFHRDDACEGTFGCWTYLKIEMITRKVQF